MHFMCLSQKKINKMKDQSKMTRKVEKKVVLCGIIIVCKELKEYERTDFGCPKDAGLY